MYNRNLRKSVRRFAVNRRKRFVVRGLGSDPLIRKPKALLYYKTDGIYNSKLAASYSHTNVWESAEMARLLVQQGFEVDVVDRQAESFQPKDEYQLFIGMGSGYSGKKFGEYARRLPSAQRVLLTTGPMPRESDRLVNEQYARFNSRYGTQFPPERTFPELPIEDFIELSDAILSIGEKGQFSYLTWSQLGKEVHTYLPSTSASLTSERFRSGRKSHGSNDYVCFAGNGFIVKGVDIVTEAFLQMPDISLSIYGPDNDRAFFEVLGPMIAKSPNIRFGGFLDVNSSKFDAVVSTTRAQVFASSSEACATSVVTMMRAGVVPITTFESGVDVSSCGLNLGTLTPATISDICSAVEWISQLSYAEYDELLHATLSESNKYTQSNFRTTFSQSLSRILGEEIPGY